MKLSLYIQGAQSLKLVRFHQIIIILSDIDFSSELNERMGDRKVSLMPYEEVVRLGEKRSGERKSAGLVTVFSELPLLLRNRLDLRDVSLPLTCVFLLGFFNRHPHDQF